MIGHLNFGSGVIEVGAGEALVNSADGIKHFRVESFDRLVLDYDTGDEDYYPIREVPRRHPSDNVSEAMKNAELNRSGSIENGL